MSHRTHSEAFKAEALRKLATSGRSVREVATELGIHATQLYRWQRESGKGAGVITRRPNRESPLSPTHEPAEPPRRPQDWSADEKIAAIFEASRLDEAELGGYLRQRGLHRAILDEWREAMIRASKAELSGRPDKAASADAKRVRELERELSRKDKALAEAAALLVLQKKVHAILGGGDDDTEPRSGP